MRKVYLLKSYQGHGSGEIITVSNNVAFGLIDNETARSAESRDFLVKPEFGESKAMNTQKLSRGQVRAIKRKTARKRK